MKIYLSEGYNNYVNWIPGAIIVNKIQDADLVLFEGGEDVHPNLYGADIHPTTSFNIERDKQDLFVYGIAKAYNKPMLGICRGAQFLCTRAGGKLIQHQNNIFNHFVKTFTGNSFNTSSTHHQAQNPFNLDPSDYKILAWSEDVVKYREDDKGNVKVEKDVEVAYYPKINALCIQPHPEIRSFDSRDVMWYKDVLEKFMKGEL